MNDKILLHILGDDFGKDTGLEGASYLQILEHHQKLIQALPESATTKILLKNFPIAKELSEYINNDAPLSLFQDAMRKHISALDNGDSFFFCSGWTGHGVVLEIHRQECNLLCAYTMLELV